MHLQPFESGVNTIHKEQCKHDMPEVPMEEINIGHLFEEQQSGRNVVLRRHHVWPKSGQLGATRLVEHPIDVQVAQPIRQRPYRVPETKRQQIAKEVQKMLL